MKKKGKYLVKHSVGNIIITLWKNFFGCKKTYLNFDIKKLCSNRKEIFTINSYSYEDIPDLIECLIEIQKTLARILKNKPEGV